MDPKDPEDPDDQGTPDDPKATEDLVSPGGTHHSEASESYNAPERLVPVCNYCPEDPYRIAG